MITIDSGQQQIASRDNGLMVTLVKLDTFTDHIAETIDETFYFATLPIQYQWDGVTTNSFRGVLKAVSPIARGFPHLPKADELTTRDAMEIELDGSDQGGEFPWNRLTGKNLIGAKIEVASLLLDIPTPRPDDWRDQSSLGAVHTVRFRGEITDVPEYDDEGNEFGLTCESMDPVLDWGEALNASETSQKDLGSLYPVPVGPAMRVPLVQRQVGWITTLVSPITDTYTGNVFVTDTTGLPASPTVYAMYIGTERVVCTTVSQVAINISFRGSLVGGTQTVAQKHNAGAVMIEETENARFVYSGVETLGVNALYARSPQSGELVFIPAGFYGVAQADKVIDSGTALGVVSFTQQLWADLIRLLNNEASISTQPTASVSGVETIQIPFGSHAQVTTLSGSLNCRFAPTTDAGHLMDESATGSPQNAGVFWNESGAVPNQTRVVIRARIVFKFRIEGDGINATNFHYQLAGSPLNIVKGNTLLRSYNPASNLSSYETKATEWFTPSTATTLADLINSSGTPTTSGARAFVYLNQPSGGTSAQTELFVDKSSYWEVELEPLPVTLTNTETNGAQEIGFNLDLFADVLGAVTIGSTTSESEFDDSTGWTGVNATITNVGAPGDGFTSTGNGTAVVRTSAILGISPALDFSDARFQFEYQITSGSWNLLHYGVDAIQIMLLSSAGNWVRWQFPRSVLHGDGNWNQFTLEIFGSATQVHSSAGTLDVTNIIQINIDWETQLAANIGSISFRGLQSEARTYHTHPIDIAQWLIEESAGQTSGADTATFATAKTNLPSVVMGGDLRNAGSAFADVLARIGKECRTNFVASEASGGTVYKAFNALSTYAFSSAVKTLSEFRKLKTKTKPLDEQVNEFIGVYEFRNELGAGTVDGFKSVLQANATTNDISADVPTLDITNAQARVGVQPSEPEGFLLLNDATSMIEVFAYIVKETLRGDARRYSLLVPQSIGYDLEPGDIVDFTPRWSSSSIKCRLINHVFTFDEPSIALNIEEVT